MVGAQYAQTTHQCRHLRRSQGEQLRPVHQQVFGTDAERAFLVVAETIRRRLHGLEGRHVGLLLAGIGPPRSERHGDGLPGILGGFLDTDTAGQYDQICQRHLLAAAIEVTLDAFQGLQHLGQLLWLVYLPVLLRGQTKTGTIGAATLVATPEGGGRRPGGRYQLSHGQAGRQDLAFESSNVLVVDQLMIHWRHRVLPDQLFLGHFRAQVAITGAHVTVGQFEPGTGKHVGEFLRVLIKAPGNLFVVRIKTQRQVRSQHHRLVLFALVLGVRNNLICVLGYPLLGTRRAGGQLPLIAKQVFEEVVAPLGRRLAPGHFRAATHGVVALAGAHRVAPAHALFGQACRFRVGTDFFRVARTVSLAEGVTTSDQRDGFLIVHGHTRKGFADVMGRGLRVRVAVRAFRVHVNQTHLYRGQRVFQVALTGIALVAIQPTLLGTPVDVVIRLPGIFPAAGKTKGLEAHGFQRHVAGQNHQVGPGNLAAVLLLDRPQQPTGLVQVHVVRPAIQRRKTLLTTAAAAATITDAIGTGTVPGHANKKATIMTEIRRPPVLGVGHERIQIFLHRSEIKTVECLGVIETFVHGIGLGGMLIEKVQTQLVGPPILVGRPPTCCVINRTFTLCHSALLPCRWVRRICHSVVVLLMPDWPV